MNFQRENVQYSNDIPLTRAGLSQWARQRERVPDPWLPLWKEAAEGTKDNPRRTTKRLPGARASPAPLPPGEHAQRSAPAAKSSVSDACLARRRGGALQGDERPLPRPSRTLSPSGGPPCQSVQEEGPGVGLGSSYRSGTRAPAGPYGWGPPAAKTQEASGQNSNSEVCLRQEQDGVDNPKEESESPAPGVLF